MASEKMWRNRIKNTNNPIMANLPNKPAWVIEVEKEIVRLEKKIARLNKKYVSSEVNGIDALEDISNWEGWLHGLKWCLRMRDGKATRKDAWGRS